MRFSLNYIMALSGAAAVATAIAAAPIAAAAPAAPSAVATAPAAASDPAQVQSCTNTGGTQTECQSPGNVQLNDSLPQVDYFPYAGGAT
jgi:hypothetical protein